MFWLDSHWQLQHIFNQVWWPAQLILLTIWILCAYFAWKKPIFSLSIIASLLPTYLLRSNLFGIPLTYLELLIVTTIIIYLLNTWCQKEINNLFKKLKNYRWPLLLIILGSTIGMLISPDIRSAAGLWKAYVIEPILLFSIAKKIIASPKDKELIVWSLSVGGMLIGALAIYQYFTGFAIAQAGWTNEANRRTTSLFTSPNAVGLFLGPLIVLYFSWLIGTDNKKQKLIKLSVILLFIVAVLTTKSIGTVIGLTAASLFFLALMIPDNLKKKIIVASIVFIIGLSAFSSAIDITKNFRQKSLANRLTLITMSKDYISSNPATITTGAGILGFAKYQDGSRDPLILEDLLYPHNIILNFLFEWGISGLLGMMIIFYMAFKQGLSILKNQQPKSWLTIGILMALITILAHGLIDVPYFKNDLAVMFWLLLVLI